jgi:hypothetical protein
MIKQYKIDLIYTVFFLFSIKKTTLTTLVLFFCLEGFSTPIAKAICFDFSVEKPISAVSVGAGDCKLMEEKINGITQVTYAYDAYNRLILKKNILSSESEAYAYDSQGFLIEINNNSNNGFNIKYEYTKGLLVKKTYKSIRIAVPKVTTYFYNTTNELIKMSEKYLSETITEFSNGKAIRITNPFINFELNDKGLVIKSSSISSLETFNLYTYNSNDMLLKQETYERPGKKVIQNQFEISDVKRTKMGSEFVDTYQGIPYYKNPFGDDKFYINKITKYMINPESNTPVKVFENQINHGLDSKGNIISMIAENDSSTATISYVYSGCSK